MGFPQFAEAGFDWASHDERVRAEEAREQAKRNAENERRKTAAWLDMGLGVREAEAIRGDLRECSAIAACHAFSEENKSMLVLSGPTGCGKTIAAAQWLVWGDHLTPAELSKRVRKPLFVTAAELGLWSRFSREDTETLTLASALVLDDMGQQYRDAGGAAASFVDGLLNARYRNRLPTVMTTNLTLPEFVGWVGERVRDRLRHDGDFIALTGPHFRGGDR